MAASRAMKMSRHENDPDASTPGSGHIVPFSKSSSSESAYSRFRETVALVEKAHRAFMDTVKDELVRLRVDDLNATQAIIIYKIGEKSIAVGELASGSFHNGTNPTYNIKHLKKTGYVKTSRCSHDLRIVRASLTEKGKLINNAISRLFERQSDQIMARSSLSFEEVKHSLNTLHYIERQLLASIDGSFRYTHL